MYLKIKNLLLVVSLIAALVIASEKDGFAMGNQPSYRPGNQGGQQYGNNGADHWGNPSDNGQGNHNRRHHSAPEPSTLILIGTGLVGLWAFRKKLL